MRAQGIYINVSRRNEDVFEMLDDYTQMKDFEDQSKADTVIGILRSYPKLITYKRRCHQLEKKLEELGVAYK